ncbi:hypothetical protein FI667_g7841, partial [Globisporangium splendens]
MTVTRAPLPLSVAWLENATLEISATQRHKRDVRYVLTVHHKPSHSKWTLSRSYDEYRQFQQRFLETLESGHFCHAECPWLYTFVLSYFPKSCLFRSSSARVIQFRRETLQKYMTTLQSVLLNRDNHCCSVLMTSVVSEFTDFVCGPGGLESLPLKQWAFAQARARGSRDSIDSLASTSDEENPTAILGSSNSSGSFVDVFCSICDHEVDGYKTRLRCGHEFHDECILPKLNESMKCPTCGLDETDE